MTQNHESWFHYDKKGKLVSDNYNEFIKKITKEVNEKLDALSKADLDKVLKKGRF